MTKRATTTEGLVRQAVSKALRAPVFLFQMGKVGSSALKATLSHHHPGLVIHAHRYADLSPIHKAILKWRRRLRLPVFVVCPVRDPLSRNVSAFFQNFKRDTGHDLGARDWSVGALQELFLKHYPHHLCLKWFDKHLLPTFGVDVLAEPFPIERKWQTYATGTTRLLVYRSDLARADQLGILSEFLGIRIENWHYDNVSAEKDYAKLYEGFCAEANLPEEYIGRMCNSRFSRHFWSASEIARHACKWRRRDEPDWGAKTVATGVMRPS